MTKASLVTVLVEDQRQQRFVLNYLKKQLHYENYQIRALPLTGGRSSGEQSVRKRYAMEVRAHRNRATRARSALVIAIDADSSEVVARHLQLHRELDEAGSPPRAETEAIVHLIPKRNIETWILCLTGRIVDEVADYKRDDTVESAIVPATASLFAWSRPNAQPGEDCVPSLTSAILEVRRRE